MFTRWIWVAMLCVVFLMRPGLISAELTPHQAKASETVSPEDWARLSLEGCHVEQRRRDEDLARLTNTLTREAQSKEEQSFPNEEARSYAKLLEKERHV